MRGSMKVITRLLSLVCVVLCVSGWDSNAYAQGAVQASIAGVVRDTSGAVLPGVTIEASSPVLIEKARTAVSDETGRYRIIALNPGTYTVTFRSAVNGFADLLGAPLDGANTGNPAGSNYVGTFVVGATPTVVGIPSFARGPNSGQTIELPATSHSRPMAS